nr:hypothetical protein [Actinomadura sp. CNU-125]
MRPGGHLRDDPVHCEEYGYGLGNPDGIFVLKYRSASGLVLGETRQDFLHQLYWSPDGVLAVLNGASTEFLGPREGYWAARATAHEVRAGDRQTVYRVCLREVPPALRDRRCGPVTVAAEAAELVRRITRRDCDEGTALAARRRIMAGLTPCTGGDAPRPAAGGCYALTVAPPSPTTPPTPPRSANGRAPPRQREDPAARLRPRIRHALHPLAHPAPPQRRPRPPARAPRHRGRAPGRIREPVGVHLRLRRPVRPDARPRPRLITPPEPPPAAPPPPGARPPRRCASC